LRPIVLAYDLLGDLKIYQGYITFRTVYRKLTQRGPYWIKGDKYEAAANVLYGKVPEATL